MRFLLKYIICLITILFCFNTSFAQKKFKGTVQNGDLLFQDLDCGPLCDAIEQVTKSYAGRHFSHIGIVSEEGAFVFVIEAIGDKVKRTPIDEFVSRNNNEILLGRVKKQYRDILPHVLDFTLHQIDVPYDEAFLFNNGKYYCSELLYDAFKFGNKGEDFFVLEPMTFKQPNTNEYFPAWVDYYKDLRIDIPEASPGINPGGISTSPKLDMYLYKK